MPRTLAEWETLASRTALPAGMWIDGAITTEGSEAPVEVIGPRDGRTLTALPAAGAGEVDRAVKGARAAFEAGHWSRATAEHRGRVLQRWAGLVEEHRDELALLITLEMGKPVTASRDVEVTACVSALRWYGEVSGKLLDESPRGLTDALALVTREPVGVVGAITPWNMPVTLLSWKLGAALVAGNSVVVKPAAQSPLSALLLARLGTEAGLPDGVLQVLVGTGPVAGSALALHDGVDCLTFTGSPEVGKRLQSCAARSNAKPVWLELGGKTPFVVLPGARLDAAADALAWGITFNSGQLCTAASRLIVHREIAGEFTASVVDRIAARVVGDPLDPAVDMGPVASERHRESVLSDIRRGIDEGAELVHGSASPRPGDGWYLEPAVLTGVGPKSSLAQEEVFGPVLSVITAADTEDAVRLANDSRFGLGSSVWTGDVSTALSAARRIDAGTVWVNCFEEGDMSVPFGGRKLSGHGADKSLHGIDKFTTLKTTWIAL
ncbi:aldehyde dehydrogenase family protein [Streptomyces sp. SID8352]|uniref:aldehyde dehydrogenase family protein n=1 Tax=Streptomyces sp. SID8352 TaxID=2690338 RepID=UPI00136886C5|nr:aldehyde dehydrogenase family protein [Streptomyces sp. SID8352]MYU22604.1 aldehyde dehydrogenase family protein [Streptomyces sp. SID8352]